MRAKIWKFLNSSFGLWLLSTCVVGLAVWSFNQAQETSRKKIADGERYERLSYEAAGRVSQFLRWLPNSLVEQKGNEWEFRETSNLKERLFIAFEGFSDLPRQREPNKPYIQAMLPEFKEATLFGVYSEMYFLGRKIARERIEETKRGEVAKTKGAQDYLKQEKALANARLALVEPNWLFNFGDPKFENFRFQFYSAFVSRDIEQWDLPYTDCFGC